MPDRKGFTLIEIIVALIIIGILAAIAIPNYSTLIIQGSAKATQNNLITIYNAEKNFWISNGYYCSTSSQNATCADTLPDLNNNLALNIIDNYFSYACSDPNSASDSNKGTAFSCTATNISDNNLSLTIIGGPPNSPQIILPGGTGCTVSPWNSPCNPSCATNVNTYCPSS